MEKLLWMCVFLCSALLEVQSLECYVCDNCPKVKLDQIETCGPTTIPKPSTTMTAITESPTTTSVAPKLSSSTPTILTPTTIKTTSAATTISSTITTKDITTSTKTTEASPTTTTTTQATSTSTIETRPSTEFNTPAATSSTATMENSNTPITSSAEPINNSTDATISTSSFNSATIEPETINTPAQASITTEPMEPTTITIDVTTSSTTTFIEHTNTPNEEEKHFLSEPVISSVTVTEFITDKSVSFISTVPTTTTVTVETFLATEPTIQNFSTISTSSKHDAEPIIQNIPTLPTLTAGPIATSTTESATKIPIISATNYPESTVSNIGPNKQTNGTYNLRRISSSSEGCACKNEQKCDCWTHGRSKRYALRGLGLSKEGVKYVCFVDKYEINETEVVKRGCAVKEEEKTSCTKLGFGVNCKICDTDQCNGAAVIQSSILLTFTLYLILQ